LQDENHMLVDKQYDLVLEKLKELDPFIQYIKRNGIYFSHPEIDHLSARGPIIGYNDNEYFVYSLEEERVKVVNRYSLSDKKDMHLYTFVSEYNFEKIMQSLEYIKQIPKLYVEQLKNVVEQRKRWIEQYS
jgi:aspartate/methionine/tyrosine aminotransferase